MIRLIVQVTDPDPFKGTAGTYRTFDVSNKPFQDFLAANGFKTIIGCDVITDPAPAQLKPVEKVDPDALPKDASALQIAKHKKALGLKASGKLPAKMNDKETIFEQLARFEANLEKENAKEKEERAKKSQEEQKKREEANKKLKKEQAEWDRHSLTNKLLRRPRPEKEAA